jgi:hypothetical protein
LALRVPAWSACRCHWLYASLRRSSREPTATTEVLRCFTNGPEGGQGSIGDSPQSTRRAQSHASSCKPGKTRPPRTLRTQRSPRTPPVGIVSQAAVVICKRPRDAWVYEASRGCSQSPSGLVAVQALGAGAVLRGLGVLRVPGGLLLPLGARACRRALCGPRVLCGQLLSAPGTKA